VSIFTELRERNRLAVYLNYCQRPPNVLVVLVSATRRVPVGEQYSNDLSTTG